ncbi:hypothetical protein TgHK011_008999 [Trichoderma gracile]|nr:hypothetical protein TgHK011_008999 [Trichoderma gracile]
MEPLISRRLLISVTLRLDTSPHARWRLTEKGSKARRAPTMAAPSSKKRLVHHLDTPFSTSSWPVISIDDQDSILELLCHLLSPIGQHRRLHIKPSKGKRAARREKKTKMKLDEPSNSVKIEPPPVPELSASVDVGFNSIVKNLGSTRPSDGSANSDKGYSMIFVARGSQSPAFNQHFPQMVAAASRNLPDKEKIRLVGFSKPCSERLGSVLGIPRVSSVAISAHAPGADALFALVQNTVSPVESPWLDEATCATYKPTRISSDLASPCFGNMSGYQDPEKLAAARELAQAFSKVKDPKKKKSGGGGGQQPRYEQWEPYPPQHHPPQHHGHHAQFAPQQYWQNAGPPHITSVPPPSQRMYASTTSFSTGRTSKVSVIGNAGLEFIKQAGMRPQAAQAQPSQGPSAGQTLYTGFQPDIGNNNVTDYTQFTSTFPQASGATGPGNILETFLAIAAKKPTLGQEIETLAEILPKAMDLNAQGATATDAQAGTHMSYANFSQEQNGKVQGNGNSKANDANTARTNDKQGTQTRGSHSRKLSPVAAVFVPANNGASQQSASVNKESKILAAQQTKGLSGSMWA